MTFRHRAGVSPYTSPFGFAETCVFDKQSLGPFHCGHFSVAPLLPKLRGQFAEFLNNPSPAGLRFLTPSTCVGLRYGRVSNSPYPFLAVNPSELPYLCFSPLRPGITITGHRSSLRVRYFMLRGHGISTVCASTTPFGLALAPG